jgi:quercetin dioxygenase-like cupin family protein
MPDHSHERRVVLDGITVKNLGAIEAYAGEHAIPGIRFRPARQALGVEAWGMSVLELDPHCSGYPAHHHGDDGHEEVYVVLRGSIVLQAGGSERVLVEGDLVRIAPPVARKFVTRDQGATLLALGGTPGRPYTPSMGTPA